jgi:hypothetical protein
MADIQEQLIRASAIARLGSIVRELETSRQIADEERQWFAELLHPLATNAAGAAHLAASSVAVSRAEGSAMLEILQEHFVEHADLTKLEQYVRLLSKLRKRLLESNTIEVDLLPPALEIARKLRSHFLGFESPTNPNAAQVA